MIGIGIGIGIGRNIAGRCRFSTNNLISPRANLPFSLSFLAKDLSKKFFFSSIKKDLPLSHQQSDDQQPSTSSSSTEGKSELPNNNQKELQEKIKSLQDSYLQTLADMENLRTRTKKEVENASIYGIQKFSKDIINVADVLEVALNSVPKEQLNDNSQLRILFDGLSMTLTELMAVLKRNGVEPFSPLHQKFDPNMHNAIYQIPTAEYEPGMVVDVQKKGYLLRDRLIRPATVGISTQNQSQ